MPFASLIRLQHQAAAVCGYTWKIIKNGSLAHLLSIVPAVSGDVDVENWGSAPPHTCLPTERERDSWGGSISGFSFFPIECSEHRSIFNGKAMRQLHVFCCVLIQGYWSFN